MRWRQTYKIETQLLPINCIPMHCWIRGLPVRSATRSITNKERDLMKLIRHKGLIGTKAVAVEARREQRCAEAHGWWEQPFWGS